MTYRNPDPLLKQVPLTEYFKERVTKALANQNIPASPTCEFYIVNLLQEFRKSEKLFEKQGKEWMEKPLALLLAKAAAGSLQTKIRCLKQLGDISLYTAGFFGERIQRQPVGVHYYIRMGGGAYSNLASLLNDKQTFAELYAELAQLFPDLIDVLTEVATASQWTTNKDLLKLYEKWLETGNRHFERLLNEEGIQTQDRDLLKTKQ